MEQDDLEEIKKHLPGLSKIEPISNIDKIKHKKQLRLTLKLKPKGENKDIFTLPIEGTHKYDKYKTISPEKYQTPRNALEDNNTLNILKELTENTCPCGDDCSNYKKIGKILYSIKQLFNENNNVYEINYYLSTLLKNKEEHFKRLINENVKLKFDVNVLSSFKKNKEKYAFKNFTHFNQKSSLSNFNQMANNTTTRNISPSAFSNTTCPSDRNLKNNKKLYSGTDILSYSSKKSIRTINTGISRPFSSRLNEKFRKSSGHQEYNINEYCCNNALLNHLSPTKTRNTSAKKINSPFKANTQDEFDNDISCSDETNEGKINIRLNTKKIYSSTNYYEDILNTNYNSRYKQYPTSLSFLSATQQQIEDMENNKFLQKIYSLVQKDELALNALSNLTKKEYLQYIDSIGSLIKEHSEILKVISRVKEFLNCSVDLVDSILLEDSSLVLIKNTCKILKCERASLFIYDKYIDKLILYNGRGLKHNDIQVPKDKGVVGYTFTTGKKVRIDEAYSDLRFNKEIDKMNNFRTKNILCFPLKNRDGSVFGVIQAINKNHGCFDQDDMELMDIFSRQASCILKSMMNIDNASTVINKLKILNEYSYGLMNVNTLYEITRKTEILLNVLFTSTCSKVFFCDNENKMVNNYTNENEYESNKRLGILAYVWKHKELYACNSVKTCPYYNNICDITVVGPVVTFPIVIDEVTSVIMQFNYTGSLSEKTMKPNDSEIMMMEQIKNAFKIWYVRYLKNHDNKNI